MTKWRERKNRLVAEYVKRHPRKPTPTYQKITVWVMVLATLIGMVCLWLYR